MGRFAKRTLFGTLIVWSTAIAVADYTCPEDPDWRAVPCSMHEAIRPTDWDGFDLTFVADVPSSERYDPYRDYVVVSGPTSARLRVYDHFENPDWVAKRLAKAWAGQPAVLRRSAMPLLLSVDFSGPVYWDYTGKVEGFHIVEYPYTYVHEEARTLDWSFEELLTHELCHVVDRKGGYRDEDSWREAVDADGGHVTDYAASSVGEDFAESCAAYVLTGIGERLTETHRAHVRDTMPARSAWFDGLFGRWVDLIEWKR